MRTAFAVAIFFLLGIAAAPAGPVKVGAFTFALPDGWKTVTPSSPMRKAQLEIAQGSDKAEVTFFQFDAGQGGSAADNVARWFGQFPDSKSKQKTETIQAGSVKVTYAATEGTFSSGMPGAPTTPMSSYALCGAILESPDGNVFIKMTGPATVVKSSSEAFKKMVSEAAKNSTPRV